MREIDESALISRKYNTTFGTKFWPKIKISSNLVKREMVAQKQLYVYPSILKNYGRAIFARKTWTFQHNIYARIEHLKTYTQLGTSNIPRFLFS
jgi:hypothetical protein